MSTISQQVRAAVIARARNRCEYCLFPAEYHYSEFEADHILPISRGGHTSLDNLAFACPRCNAHKWAHYEIADHVTGEVLTVFSPRRDVWSEHFRWSVSKPFEIEGITPCGRVTAATLQMNDPRIVALRQTLAELGVPIKPST